MRALRPVTGGYPPSPPTAGLAVSRAFVGALRWCCLAVVMQAVVVPAVAAQVLIDPTTLSILENSTDIYTVRLANQPSGTATVVATVTGTGHDLTLTPTAGTALTFTTSTWNQPQMVTVAAAMDSDTTNETVTITHSIAGYPGVTTAPSVTVNADERLAFGAVQTAYTVAESAGTVSVCAETVSGPPDARFVASSLLLNSPNGSAEAGDDYVAINDHLLTFNSNGQRCVDVSIIDDNIDEGDEDFHVTMTLEPATRSRDSLILVDPDLTTITITDDDTDGVTVTQATTPLIVDENRNAIYTMVLTTDPGGPVTITPSIAPDGHDLSLTPGGALTFTAATWNSVQTVTVAAGEDSDAFDDSATISHMVDGYGSVTAVPVTVTVDDNDDIGATILPVNLSVPEGGTSIYTVALDLLPTGDVVVTPMWAGLGDTNVATFLPGTLTFTTTTWNVEQTVTVTGVQDADAASDSPLTLNHRAAGGGYDTGSDPGEGGGFGTSLDSVMVTVVEDDAEVTIAPATLSVAEGASGTYTVVLDARPGGNVTITPSIAPDGHDLTLGDALTFTLANWNSAQTVSVFGGEDSDSVDDVATITHSVNGYGSGSFTADPVTVTITDDDTPGVTLSATALTVTEGATGIYTVVLDSDPLGDVRVTPASDDPSVATVSGPLFFNGANWNTARTVTVTGADDGDSVDDATTITHTVAGYGSVTADPVAVTVTDNDTPGVTLSATALTVTEGATGTYTVVLDTDPLGNVTVTPASGDTAVATAAGFGSLIFTTANWNIVQTVVVTGAEDSDSVDAATTITHTVNGYGSVAADPVAVTVTDNDIPGVTLSATALTVTEGATGTYTVVLNTEPLGNVTVTPASGDTAVATVTGALIFTVATWNTARTVSVNAAEDGDDVDAATSITHAVNGYGSVTADPVAVTVTDDDDPPGVNLSATALTVPEGATGIYTVVLNSDPAGNVTVTPTSGDTAAATVTGALTFTVATWNTAQTVTVTGVEDSDSVDAATSITHEVNGYGSVTADPVTVAITDNDAPGVTLSPTALTVTEGVTGTYTVALTTEPAGDVTLTSDVAPSDHDLTLTPSGALTFTPSNWNTGQTVTVVAAEDVDAVNDAATISHAASGADYDAVTDTLPVTIRERVAVGFNPTTYSVSEGAGLVGVCIDVTMPTVGATVDGMFAVEVSTADGTATSSQDYGSLRDFVILESGTAGADPRTGCFGISIVDDMMFEGSETFTVEISGVAGSNTVPDLTIDTATATATITIIENDTPPGVTLSATALTVTEGATGTYTVVLDSNPAGDVTVTPTSGDMAVATVTGALTFTSANWNTAQTVSVNAAEDGDDVDDATTITHAVNGYGSVTADPVAVTVTDDDDPPGVTLSATALTVTEGATGIYTVVLNSDPAGNVTVTPTSGDTSAATVTGALTFTVATWNTAQTVTVTGVEDSDSVDAATSITHEVNGYGSVTADPVTVAITDNDAPRVTLSPTALTVTEGVNGAYAVALATEPAGDVTITSDVAPSDHDLTLTPSGALTFTPSNWNTGQTVTVVAAEDVDTVNDTATISYAASGADYDAITAALPVTIRERVAVGFNPTTYSVSEGAGLVGVCIDVTMPTVGATVDGMFAVAVSTADGTATATSPQDYVSLSDFVTGASATAGDDPRTGCFPISIVDDMMFEGNETFTVEIRRVAGSNTVPDLTIDTAAATATVTITDNDDPGVTLSATALTVTEGATGAYTVVLDTEPAGNVTVTPTSSDMAAATVTGALIFTVANWNTAQTVSVTAAEDGDDVDDATTITHAVNGYGSVTAAPVPVTVTDNDDPPGVTLSATAITVTEGATGIYTVVLNSDPAGNVTVTPTSSDMAAATVTGALIFTVANWNTAQTVTVTAAEDGDDVDDATTITHAVNGYGSVTADPVAVTVTDDDDPPGVTLSATALTVTEGATGIYTVVLNSDPAGNVTVTPTSGDTAAATVTGALTFTVATWNTAQTVTVTAAEDSDGIDDATTITHAVNGYGSVTAAPVAVTVTDNDPPGVTLSPTALTVPEGATGIYTVVLDSEPAGAVMVTPASGATAVATVTGALAFTVANWNTVQTVTVTGAADNDSVDEAATITHAVTGYGSVTTATPVTVTVPDTNSVPDFGTTSVTPRTYTVGEPIPTLTLPTASDGDGALSYALTPMDDIPAGLTYTRATRTLTGTPVSTMTPVTRLTWTATDANDDATPLIFTIVILANTDAKTRRDALNRVIIPEVARAIADQGVSAVARRIRQAGSDSVDAGQTLTLGGQSTLAGVLTTHGRALAEGAFNLKTLLGGSAFVLPLNASEVAPGTGLSALTLWGGGDYRVLSGKGDAINWDGDLFSARLGADARLRDDLLAGVAVSWSEADLDYLDSTNDGNGDYEVGLTSVHPYIGWTALGGRLDLWATAGYGWGELEITTVDDDEDSEKSTSDVTMQTIGAGGSAQVLESHAATLRIKGEALQTTMDVEGSESITAVELEARRLRLGLEASRTHQLANGGQLVPTVEVGMRHDAGDGRTGTGAEVGGGMRYTDAANGLTVESHGRVLLGHSGDYQDWGIGGVVRLAAGRDGQGLSFSLQPTWGATASRAAQVWAQEAVAPASAVSRPRDGRVDMNLGYGLGWDEMLVTPYGNMTLTNGSARAYRLGSRMRLGGGMTLNLEGIRDETAARLVNHGIRLQVRGSDRTTFSLEGTRKETATQALNHGITLQLGLNF